ncbi:peptidase [Thalassomonas viridans]|uniref:Peptidase n=1 Tax=Thalassomonas viridans TaxID=137584 RepID=A0AAF0C885_9GAMM|nr:S41 family peptidase [Thalassomonas viridans]WDE04141.1 peptidase [Thalassomonas viridans]
MKKAISLLGLSALLLATTMFLTKESRKEFSAAQAWQEFEQVFNSDYAYMETSGVDADKLLAQYKTKALQSENESEFIDVIQILLRYFRDPHLTIGPMNEQDYSVTPTGSDIWAKTEQGKYYIEDLKGGGAAAEAGMKIDSEILAIDGLTLDQTIARVFGGELLALSEKQKLWAVNIALGGLRYQPRTVTVRENQQERVYKLAASYDAVNRISSGPVISFNWQGDIGYIRFNNSLGKSETVAAFKEALNQLLDTSALILDLRDTPSGGNTGVAEPVLGHFVREKTVYQLYQRQQDGIPFHQAEMEKAYVEPNTPFYDKPFIVLAGRWTGSMGEGMTIGLDALGAKAVIGAPTADLLGGIKNIQLEYSNAILDLGFERMFHVNGSYREDFLANIVTIPADHDSNGEDPALNKALEYLSKNTANQKLTSLTNTQ